MRTACLSTGLKERGQLFERFATVVIKLGELEFAVRRQSSSAVLFQLQMQQKNLFVRKSTGREIADSF